LGMMINSKEMTVSLPQGKVEKIIQQCQVLKTAKEVTVLDLTRLIGRLSSSALAVLPARLQYRSLQNQQILSLKRNPSFLCKVVLNHRCLAELEWWITNLINYNGRSLKIIPPEMVISSDASMKGWGAACKGKMTGGKWSKEDQLLHINILELKAASYAILAFTTEVKPKSLHIQMDNKVALTYLLKRGGTVNMKMNQISKEIWEYLLHHGIMITVEYLPTHLNVEADWASRKLEDKSEWKLSQRIFQQLCQRRGFPQIDLFASVLNHQLATYYAWRPDPNSKATDAFQQPWGDLTCTHFPHSA